MFGISDKEIKTLLVADEETFYRLVLEISERISKNQKEKPIWISEDKAKKLLGVKSSTTMWNFRKKGLIEYTMTTPKTILYKRKSIENYLEKKSFKTF